MSKLIGVLDIREISDIEESEVYDNQKYVSHGPGFYWLPNVYGGSYVVAVGEKNNLLVNVITTSQDGLPFDPAFENSEPDFGADEPKMPEELIDEVVSVRTFLKALAITQGEASPAIVKEVLKNDNI